MLLSYGNSEDYYLSIGIEKSWVWALFVNLDFLGPKKGVASKPDQNFDTLVELFGRHAISKYFLKIVPNLHQSRNLKIEDDC